jgi:AraC-like DNA-binding protein
VDEGSGIFVIDGHECIVEHNQLFFTTPYQIREWKLSKMPRGLVVFFEEEFLCNFFNDALFVQNLSFFRNGTAIPCLKLSIEQGEYLRSLLFQIEHEILENKEHHLLRALLYQVLAWLNKVYQAHYGLKPVSTGQRMLHFNGLVENNFCHEHTVAFYANELCITPGHLNELVKKEMGISCKQFIINRLILEAKRLLLYSEISISTIADDLGFTDPSYFIRLFKKETGISPLTFRNEKSC